MRTKSKEINKKEIWKNLEMGNDILVVNPVDLTVHGINEISISEFWDDLQNPNVTFYAESKQGF